MHAVSPRRRLVLAGAAVAVVVAAGVTAFVATRPAALTLTVHFVEAPGLYPGNNVDIRGHQSPVETVV